MKPKVLFLYILGFSLFVHSLWLAAEWPGLFVYDMFGQLVEARDFYLNRWSSYSFSAYLIALQTLSPSPGLIGIVQSLIVSILLAAFFYWAFLRSGNSMVVAAMGLFLSYLPLQVASNIYYGRHWGFAWMHLSVTGLFAVLAFDYKYLGRLPKWWHLAILSLLAILLVDLRHDGKVVVAALVLLFPLLFFQQKKIIYQFLAFLFVPLIVLSASGVIEVVPADKYVLTGMVNPLSYLLQNNVVPTAQDKADIERVFDYNRLLKSHDDYEIPAFHNQAFKRDYTHEDLQALRAALVRMIWANPDLFLQNRLKMAAALLGNFQTRIIFDDLTYQPANVKEKIEKLQIRKEPLSENLHNALRPVVLRYLPMDRGFPWDANVYISLILCLISLPFFRLIPVSASASLLIAARLPIVFLLAPAPHFHYIYSLYLWPFALIPLIIAERHFRGSKQLAQKGG